MFVFIKEKLKISEAVLYSLDVFLSISVMAFFLVVLLTFSFFIGMRFSKDEKIVIYKPKAKEVFTNVFIGGGFVAAGCVFLTIVPEYFGKSYSSVSYGLIFSGIGIVSLYITAVRFIRGEDSARA